MTRIEELEEKVKTLAKKLATNEKIRRVLMDRVEKSIESSGSAYTLFETNILLQQRVRQRTEELEKVNQKLLQEIIDRKRADEALQEQIQRNKLILQNAIDGFLIIDKEGKILEANNAASLILGYSNEEMVGIKIRDFKTVKISHEAAKHLTKVMKKKSDRFETKFKRKDGQIVQLEVTTNFVHMADEDFFFSFFHDITKRKKADQALKAREKELEIKNISLEELNSALKVLLKKRDEDKTELEEKVLFNMKELVLPYVEKFKNSRLDGRQKVYLGIIESHLNDIISPFAYKLSSKYYSFTPKEIRVANLVKQGKTNKEIAELFHSSPRTIAFHRENIRKKLGLKNKKTNLEAHLLSLT